MKRILIALLLVMPALVSSAQSYEGTVSVQKKDQKAMVVEFPFAPSVVEDAIVDKGRIRDSRC